MEKISVIISAYNEEGYIAETIESFKKNKLPFELIVICDSCTDKTKEIALQYTDLVFEVDFKNISKVRNFGFEKASGEILVFVDADTIVSENYLEEILKISKDYDFGSAKRKTETNNIWGQIMNWSTNTNYCKKNIGGNFFIKKEFFNRVGGFNINMKLGEDTDLGDRLHKIGARYHFMDNCFIIPSERRFKRDGYFYLLIKSIFMGFIYRFFRNYYNKISAK